MILDQNQGAQIEEGLDCIVQASSATAAAVIAVPLGQAPEVIHVQGSNSPARVIRVGGVTDDPES